MSKIILFEYFLKKLVEWHCEFYQINYTEFNTHNFNNLSKLKVIKLHFFACSAHEPALEIFSDFQAMPYGHVESDVYNKLSELKYCLLNNFNLTIRNPEAFFNLSPENASIMDSAVNCLKQKNYNLIKLEPFQLVELSHKWYSWRTTFDKARNQGLFSKPIGTEIIRKEEKFYSLY